MSLGPDKVVASFVITRDQQERLKAVKERDGVPESEQVRRALAQWFASKTEDTPRKVRRKTARN